MNTILADIYEKEIYARILFSIWNEPKTVYNIAKELIQKDIEHVIIKCPKCGQKNIFPLIKKLKDSSYSDVNPNRREGVERFRKFIKKSQKCKRILSNKKICRRPLFKYRIVRKKRIKEIIKESVLQNIEDISYDFFPYTQSNKTKSHCSNIKRDYLEVLKKERIIKTNLNKNYLCSINWKNLTNLIISEIILRITTYLSKDKSEITRFVPSRKFSISLEENRKYLLKSDESNAKELIKKFINISDKQHLTDVVKKFYTPNLKYKNLNEFIEWFILSFGQWTKDTFLRELIEYYKFRDIKDIKRKLKGEIDLFTLQEMCYQYKLIKERAYFKQMSLNLFQKYPNEIKK